MSLPADVAEIWERMPPRHQARTSLENINDVLAALDPRDVASDRPSEADLSWAYIDAERAERKRARSERCDLDAENTRSHLAGLRAVAALVVARLQRDAAPCSERGLREDALAFVSQCQQRAREQEPNQAAVKAWLDMAAGVQSFLAQRSGVA